MPRKQNRVFKKYLLAVCITICVILALVILEKTLNLSQHDETNFVLYPGFGIQMPENFAIHGIDVSRYQNKINWPMVKGMKDGNIKIGFAFIKATEGVGLADVEFKRNWKKVRESKIPRGAYHFFIARKNGKLQAQNFINTVKLLPGDLPPILDIEVLNGTEAVEMQKNVADWLAIVEAHYGIKPIIYSNAAFYNNYLKEEFGNYPLWVAHYLEKHTPRVKSNWLFWQHNESGRVNGVSSLVDFNVFNGDSAAFKALLIKKQ